MLWLNLVELQELLVDEDIEVDLIIILQNCNDALELPLQVILSIFNIMFRFQEIEEVGILRQNSLIQVFGQIIVSHLSRRAQRDQSLLEEPFVQEVKLISALGHEAVFILVFLN